MAELALVIVSVFTACFAGLLVVQLNNRVSELEDMVWENVGPRVWDLERAVGIAADEDADDKIAEGGNDGRV